MKINEIFKSIQGETTFMGIPSVFVRTTGCNLRCHWCDTPYAFDEGREMSLETILQVVRELGARHVVVTGGEPLLQREIQDLLRLLIERDYVTLLETSGSLPVDGLDPRIFKILDIKCPRSGMSHFMNWDNLDYLTPKDEVKFVIQDRHDYEWAKEILETHPTIMKSPTLFSPVFGTLEPSTLSEWILEDNLPVRLQPQIHKWIWGPDVRGV
jgi:7-carboxy-7-deazaguanine synthase